MRVDLCTQRCLRRPRITLPPLVPLSPSLASCPSKAPRWASSRSQAPTRSRRHRQQLRLALLQQCGLAVRTAAHTYAQRRGRRSDNARCCAPCCSAACVARCSPGCRSCVLSVRTSCTSARAAAQNSVRCAYNEWIWRLNLAYKLAIALIISVSLMVVQ